MTTFTIQPGGVLRGTFRVPGDKSISHRSIMLGSIAQGISQVRGFLEAEDALATLKAFQAMGVDIQRTAPGEVSIKGVGMHGLRASCQPLYLGNSGTSMRLLSGLLAGQSFTSTLSGDASLSGRPMRRVIDPLTSMGASIDAEAGGTAPLVIHGQNGLQAIEYEMPMGSAQVKSCILLAGLYASGETRVTEPAVTRDHTEKMLQGFGYDVARQGNTVSLHGGGSLQATHIDVPGDISSAAFFLVGASIAPGSDVLLKHVGVNPTRTGIIDILLQMGANIELLNQHEVGGEPVADLHVCSARLRGIQIPEALVPLAIDEFPVLFVAAACADGETRLTGAEELRVKESDRIQSMADGLQALGVDAQATPDGMMIRGGGAEQQVIQGGSVHSHHDHRIAMSFAMAALRANGSIQVDECENVNTSFPNFVELAQQCGLGLSAS